LSPTFAYLYFMRNDPDRVRAAVPDHVSYWLGLRLDGYLGGPFEDRSVGLITFQTDVDRAQKVLLPAPSRWAVQGSNLRPWD
jgi:hypothetical protein